jgi:hypothetical protein
MRDNALVPLTRDQRERVIEKAVDILRHRRRDRLLAILEERLARGDYPADQEEERDLDRIAWAIARAVDEQLGTDQG